MGGIMSQIRASTQINNTEVGGSNEHFIKADGSVSLRGNLDLGSNKITGASTPSASGDVANKGFVDGIKEGLSVKDSARVRAQANYDLTNASLGGESNANPSNAQVDGTWLYRNDRVLLSSQTTPMENGVYVVPDLRSEFDLTSGTSAKDMRLDLTAGNDVHTTLTLTDPGASGSISVGTVAGDGASGNPHQITVTLAHDGSNITSTVQDVVDAINGNGTASGWVAASVLSNGSTVVDQGTGTEVHMGVLNTGSNDNLDRTADFDEESDISSGAFLFVKEGTDADKGYVQTNRLDTSIGSAELGFSNFTGGGSSVSAGDGLSKSGDTLSVQEADNSISASEAGTGVNTSNTLTVDPGEFTGLGLATMTGGNLYIGQGGTGVSATTVSGDLTLAADGTATVQTSGANALITSEANEAGGIKLTPIAEGNLYLGQGTNEGGTDTASVALGGEADPLAADGTFTLHWAREDLSASTDGSTTTFSLADSAVAGKELVFVNGVLQRPDGDQDTSTITEDYALDTTNDEIVLGTAPATNDELLVMYIYTPTVE